MLPTIHEIDLVSFKFTISPDGDFVVLPPGEVLNVSFDIIMEKVGSYSGHLPGRISNLSKNTCYIFNKFEDKYKRIINNVPPLNSATLNMLEVKYKIFQWRGRNVLKIYAPSEGLANCSLPQKNLNNLREERFIKSEAIFECGIFKVTNITVKLIMIRREGIIIRDPVWDEVINKMKPRMLSDAYESLPGPIIVKLHIKDLLNYTLSDQVTQFPSPVFTIQINSSIPESVPIIFSGKTPKREGHGSMLIYTKLSPFLKFEEKLISLKYDYNINLSEKGLRCPDHRLALLIYTGHGSISTLKILTNISINDRYEVAYYVKNLKREDLCPSDVAVFYACLSGYNNGLAQEYSSAYSSISFAYTTSVPISKIVDEGVGLFVRSLLEGNSPEIAYAVYLAYYFLKAPDPEWVCGEYEDDWKVAVYASILYYP